MAGESPLAKKSSRLISLVSYLSAMDLYLSESSRVLTRTDVGGDHDASAAGGKIRLAALGSCASRD